MVKPQGTEDHAPVVDSRPVRGVRLGVTPLIASNCPVLMTLIALGPVMLGPDNDSRYIVLSASRLPSVLWLMAP